MRLSLVSSLCTAAALAVHAPATARATGGADGASPGDGATRELVSVVPATQGYLDLYKAQRTFEDACGPAFAPARKALIRALDIVVSQETRTVERRLLAIDRDTVARMPSRPCASWNLPN